MRRNRGTILFFVLLACIINHSSAEEAKQITCSGKVADNQNRPLAGVKVTLHEMVYGQTAYSHDTKIIGEVTTRSDGAFCFNTRVESNVNRYGYIVAEKEGLALGFANWRMREGDKKLQIKLGQPKELAGVVVDENDKPVAQAEVGIYMLLIGEGEQQQDLNTQVASRLLKVNTNATGKFAFTNLPAEATVDFFIKKKGRAIVITQQPTRTAVRKLQFAPGQTDIKLVLPKEAKIEGIVVEKNTGKPISGIKVMAQQEMNRTLFGQEPISSKMDGTFGINALIGGKHILRIESSGQKLADWVAEPVVVMTEAGKTKNGIKIELSKGGLLEVVVTEADSKQPVENASISIREPRNKQWFNARSDKDGIARIRLAPGGYQMSGAYKQGFTSNRRQ